MSFQEASKILGTIRAYLLELPPRNSDREEALNKKIKALYSELDMICSKVHVRLFRYTHIGMGYAMPLKQGLIIDSVEDARDMYNEYEMQADMFAMQTTQSSTASADAEEIHVDMENDLISQAGKWLDTNKNSLNAAPAWTKKVKRFFKRHWKWLIGAIIVPIIVALIWKK